MYDKKVVRLKVIYAVNFEWVLFYDHRCTKEEGDIYPDIAGDSEEKSQKIKDTISNNLKFGRGVDRVGLIVKGQFLAPHPNPLIREVGNEWPKFKIMRIEKLFEIPESTPPPGEHQTEKNSSTFKQPAAALQSGADATP